jgi:hypothetical protein
VSDRRPAIGVLLAAAVTIGAAGCSIFGTKLPPGLQACVGVPAKVCGDITQSRINERAPVALTAYRITCVVDQCTEASGTAEFVLNWADGQSETAQYGWMGG